MRKFLSYILVCIGVLLSLLVNSLIILNVISRVNENTSSMNTSVDEVRSPDNSPVPNILFFSSNTSGNYEIYSYDQNL